MIQRTELVISNPWRQRKLPALRQPEANCKPLGERTFLPGNSASPRHLEEILGHSGAFQGHADFRVENHAYDARPQGVTIDQDICRDPDVSRKSVDVSKGATDSMSVISMIAAMIRIYLKSAAVEGISSISPSHQMRSWVILGTPFSSICSKGAFQGKIPFCEASARIVIGTTLPVSGLN